MLMFGLSYSFEMDIMILMGGSPKFTECANFEDSRRSHEACSDCAAFSGQSRHEVDLWAFLNNL